MPLRTVEMLPAGKEHKLAQKAFSLCCLPHESNLPHTTSNVFLYVRIVSYHGFKFPLIFFLVNISSSTDMEVIPSMCIMRVVILEIMMCLFNLVMADIGHYL